jgi:regulatory protein
MKVLSEQELRKRLNEKLADNSQANEPESSISETELDLNPEKEIASYFLYLLGRREYSQQELVQKAKGKSFDVGIANTVIEKLKEDNYQSDFRYGEMLLRSRISKQSGPNKIKMELAAKGISDSLIEIILSNVECDWNELALLAAEKKYKPLKEESTYEEKNKAKSKLMRFLNGRGFDSEQIRYALKKLGV